MGKGKQGRGRKVMAVSEGAGFSCRCGNQRWRPGEITSVEPTPAVRFAPGLFSQLTGDPACYGGLTNARPIESRIEMIALLKPHR